VESEYSSSWGSPQRMSAIPGGCGKCLWFPVPNTTSYSVTVPECHRRQGRYHRKRISYYFSFLKRLITD
jgi:hypothetical protein